MAGLRPSADEHQRQGLPMVGEADTIQKHHIQGRRQDAGQALRDVLQCRRSESRQRHEGGAHRHCPEQRPEEMDALRRQPRVHPRGERDNHGRRADSQDGRPIRDVLVLGVQSLAPLQRLQHLRGEPRPRELAGVAGQRPHLSHKALRRDVCPQELRAEARRRGVSLLLRGEQRRAARHRRCHERADGQEQRKIS